MAYEDEFGREDRRGAAVNKLSDLTHLPDAGVERDRPMSIRELIGSQEKEIAVLHETIGDLRDRIDAMLGPEPPMDDREAAQKAAPAPARSELATMIEGQTRAIRNARLSISRLLARVEL